MWWNNKQMSKLTYEWTKDKRKDENYIPLSINAGGKGEVGKGIIKHIFKNALFAVVTLQRWQEVKFKHKKYSYTSLILNTSLL